MAAVPISDRAATPQARLRAAVVNQVPGGISRSVRPKLTTMTAVTACQDFRATTGPLRDAAPKGVNQRIRPRGPTGFYGDQFSCGRASQLSTNTPAAAASTTGLIRPNTWPALEPAARGSPPTSRPA